MKTDRLLTYAEWDSKQWREGDFTSYYDNSKALDKYMIYSRNYRIDHPDPDPDPTRTALILWRELLEYEKGNKRIIKR